MVDRVNINSVRACLTASGDSVENVEMHSSERRLMDCLKLHVDNNTKQVYLLASYIFTCADKSGPNKSQIAFNMVVQHVDHK